MTNSDTRNTVTIHKTQHWHIKGTGRGRHNHNIYSRNTRDTDWSTDTTQTETQTDTQITSTTNTQTEAMHRKTERKHAHKHADKNIEVDPQNTHISLTHFLCFLLCLSHTHTPWFNPKHEHSGTNDTSIFDKSEEPTGKILGLLSIITTMNLCCVKYFV